MAYAVSRWPVTAVFFLNGLLLSSYIVRLPSMKTGLGLTTAELGLTGTLFGGAAILAMQFTGAIAARFGNARLIRLALLVMPLSVAALGYAADLMQLAIAVMVTGIVHGTLDVAMNAYAVSVEQAGGRPILSGCHAAWSISAVAASSAGALLIKANVSTAAHLAAVAALVALGGLVVRLAPVAAAAAERGRTARRGWTRTDVLFGLTGAALMVCVGAALTWCAVFLLDVRSASLATASLAVTAYMGSQTAGRLVGDRLRRSYGTGLLFRAGGFVAAAGFAGTILLPHPATAIAALGIAGLAASNMIPMAFSAAGSSGGSDAAVSVSRFTTFTYSGILLGPSLIGWVAQGVGLTATMLTLAPLMAAVAWGGLSHRSRTAIATAADTATEPPARRLPSTP
jgi:fucose permease